MQETLNNVKAEFEKKFEEKARSEKKVFAFGQATASLQGVPQVQNVNPYVSNRAANIAWQGGIQVNGSGANTTVAYNIEGDNIAKTSKAREDSDRRGKIDGAYSTVNSSSFWL